VIGGLLLVLWGVIGAGLVTPLESSFIALLTGLPSWATSILSFGHASGLIYLLVLLFALVMGGSKRRGALRDVLVAGGVAATLATMLALAVTGAWPYVLPGWGLEDAPTRFPVMRVVVVTAILVSVSPHLSRPMRRLGWWVIFISGAAAVALGFGQPSDAVGGLGIGLVAAGGVLLLVGSPRGYPDPASVGQALGALGLPLEEVWIDTEQSWGVRRLGGRTETGDAVTIKAYGRDASDSQLLAKTWRALWYRESGGAIVRSRIEAVEHEALVTLFAARTGASVPDVIAAGQASDEIALLALSASPGTRLSIASDVSDEVMVAIWRDLGRLHAASISHGALTTSAIHVDDGKHIIGDFALGTLGATEVSRAMDVVELLFSLSVLVGAERAVRTASDGLGLEPLIGALPYLQLPAVSATAKRLAESPKKVMADLHAAVVETTQQQLPEPVKLLRIRGRSLIMSGLLLLTAWALIPLLAGIDYDAVWEILQDAEWALIFVALILGQTILLTEAVGMTFAVTQTSLPFWPLVTLQSAAKFIGLAVPGVAGRVTMNAAFLHKFGVPVTMSATQGAIDSFSGFLVEAAILIVGIFSTDLHFDTEGMDVEWVTVVVVALVLVGLTIVAVRRIRALREKVMPVIREGWGALVAVLREPRRAMGLVGSNLATRLVMAAALWIVLIAVDVRLGFGVALAVVVATNLLGGFVPVPGGIGVAEAAMTAFLVGFGVEESVAFAATLTYRVVTFYLPAVIGFPSMRWLERNSYL
jgi:uncharacterized protein (TIRG00374 family)